jgi:4-coumarate--CoA ligase
MNAFADRLNSEGLVSRRSFEEKRLAPGENKTKVAFYSFSRSGVGSFSYIALGTKY